MRKWTRGCALVALLAITGCSSPDGTRKAPTPRSTDGGSGNLYSTRLSALEEQAAALGGERAWGARYLNGASMVNAWAEGDDLLVEAFNPASRNFEVHCVDLTDGQPKWVVVIGQRGLKQAPGAGDHFVVFFLDGGGMKVVTRRTGAHHQRLRVPLRTVPVAPAGSSESTIYVASLSDQRIQALHPVTGQLGWALRSHSQIRTGPLVTPRLPRRLVVVGNDEGEVIALPAASWSDVPPEGPSWIYKALGAVSSDMAAVTRVDAKDKRLRLYVVVPCEDNGLYCLDGSAGTPLWIHRTSTPFTSPVQVGGSRVFARNEARMVVVSLSEGSLGAGAWKASEPGQDQAEYEKAHVVFAADDQRAYLGMGHRKVLKVDGRTGEVLAEGSLDLFDKLLPATDANLLVGITTDGHIVAYK